MLLREVEGMSPERAKTARAQAVRISITCEWELFIDGEVVVTANGRQPRAFKSLNPILAALDKAGINDLHIDIRLGKWGRIEMPSTKRLEALIHTYSALNNMRVGS